MCFAAGALGNGGEFPPPTSNIQPPRKGRGGETGKRSGLKIRRPARDLWVRAPPPAPATQVMFFVYVLRSRKDGALYIGLTGDLDRRIKEHNSGKERTTRHRRPFDLVHSEGYATRTEARAREKFLKTGYGREQLKRL